MPDMDTDKISAVIRECAEKYILPRYKSLQDHEITTKTGARDLVTHADIEVEEHLDRVLPGFLPGSAVIGEESISRGDKYLDILQDTNRAVWIVDPVDGTHNFVKHKREFGVMLACVIDGKTRYSWIYDVLGDEMLTAEEGGGALSDKTGPLKVSAGASLEAMKGHINPHFFPKNYKPQIEAARKIFSSCQSLNCAAHEYMRIAKGEAHFSVYSRLKPWDHLPGALIVSEAGGHIAQWEGNPYSPQDHHVGLVVANSQKTWDQVLRFFIKKDS